MSIFLLPLFGLTVIVPGLVPHFSAVQQRAYMAMQQGSERCSRRFLCKWNTPFILPACLLPVLGTLGFEGTTFGDTDFGIIGILIGLIKFIFHL